MDNFVMLTKFEENEARALVYQDGVSPKITVKMRFITQKKVLEYQGLIFVVAGAAGFEPTNVGTKSRCLTTWRRPNKKYPKNKAASVVH